MEAHCHYPRPWVFQAVKIRGSALVLLLGPGAANIKFYFSSPWVLGGHIGRIKVHRNYFCIFYLFELKLCRMVELLQKIVCFCVFNFNLFLAGKWRHKIGTKSKFEDMAKQINNLKRARRDRVKRINCVHNCEDHSSFDFISAVLIWFISYTFITFISFTGTYRPVNGRCGGGVCIYLRNKINYHIRHDRSYSMT